MLGTSPAMCYIYCPEAVVVDQEKTNKSGFLVRKYRESTRLVKCVDAICGEGALIGPEEEMGDVKFILIIIGYCVLALCVVCVALGVLPILLLLLAVLAIRARTQSQDSSSIPSDTIVAAHGNEESGPLAEEALTPGLSPPENNFSSGPEVSTSSSSPVQSGSTEKDKVEQPRVEKQMLLANNVDIFYFGHRS